MNCIVAVDQNWNIGNNGQLLVSIPADMKFFRAMTTGKTIVMGRKTFESLPGILKDRKNIVISRNNNFPKEVEVYASIEEFMEKYKDYQEEIFVIGGASIYKQFLNYCDKLYLTEVDKTMDADVYFPKFNKNLYEKEIVKEGENKSLKYQFTIYRRK